MTPNPKVTPANLPSHQNEVSIVPSVPPSEAAEVSDRTSPEEFLNRDLSWLQFNRRVLCEALDARTPLLERVRFLSIFSSNLDEFFMKRVGGLRVLPGSVAVSSARNQHLAALRATVAQLTQQQAEGYLNVIRPALESRGIRLLGWEQLSDNERRDCNDYFLHSIFPILTPLSVDPGHPFPFISNLSESLGIALRSSEHEEYVFARVKVPETLPRWRLLPPAQNPAATAAAPEFRFASLYDIIQHNLHHLFPGVEVVAVAPFRITRSIELEPADDEEAEDLREMVTEELRLRRFAPVVRLEIALQPHPWILQFLMQELELSPDDVYYSAAELDFQDLRPVVELNLPGLRHEPWAPQVPTALVDEQADIFALIRAGDMLVHHPYESFNATVERFISAAAADPKVLAIKMTLYRTGDESPFLYTLMRAAEARKQVVCIVELKARMDEERNITLASSLEKAGVHVVYGVVGLKIHTKTALVVRQDPDGIRCYAHIGTGNYHTVTARLYSDIGLLTCDPDITADLVELFHSLTGRSAQRDYRKLLVAPNQMRDRFLNLIERETRHAQDGRPAQIIAKMNSLEDRKVIRALYAASAAGVEIDLLVRGFCCLRPGVPGLSERIRVCSIIGRFLEHSRIFYFRNAAPDPADGEFFIGSADWMYRNFFSRIEVVTPVESRSLRQRLWEILQINLQDNRQGWDMRADGTYVQRTPRPGEPERGTHAILMGQARPRAAAAERKD